MSEEEDLVPFYHSTGLFLRPVYKISIMVSLPKLRQMGQSVSNWEIRERLKKMLSQIELTDFRVVESTLEEVHFDIVVNSFTDSNKAVSLLDGITFRAVGFMEPLAIKAERGKPDYPTRVDWDKHFASTTKQGAEREPGERPDTLYIGGLPFDWFRASKDTLERIIRLIFTEFGEVRLVDIPQCDQLRRQMESEISGILLSSWSSSQEPFFEAYVQFREYAGFVNALTRMAGKSLVQACTSGGTMREAKLKVDFDRSAHLSQKKITQRSIRRSLIETQIALDREKAEKENKASMETKEPEEDELSKEKREKLMRQLIRAEKRQKAAFHKNYEQVLRDKLKIKLTTRAFQQQRQIVKERERGATALLRYIATLHKFQVDAMKYSTTSIADLANEYARENNLPGEDALRERLLRKRELELKTKLTRKLLDN